MSTNVTSLPVQPQFEPVTIDFMEQPHRQLENTRLPLYIDHAIAGLMQLHRTSAEALQHRKVTLFFGTIRGYLWTRVLTRQDTVLRNVLSLDRRDETMKRRERISAAVFQHLVMQRARTVLEPEGFRCTPVIITNEGDQKHHALEIAWNPHS